MRGGHAGGAILLSRHLAAAEGRVPVATRMNDVPFKRMVRPGEVIRMEVQLTDRLADAFFLKAKVTVDGQVTVRFDFRLHSGRGPGQKRERRGEPWRTVLEGRCRPAGCVTANGGCHLPREA